MPAITGNFLVRQCRSLRFQHSHRSACDAWHDGKRLIPFELGIRLVEIAYVFVIHIHVDETSQLPLIVEQVFFKIRILSRQLAQRFRHGTARYFNRVLLLGKLPQRSRYQDLCHFNSSRSACVCSISGKKLFAWSNLPFLIESTTNEYQGHEFFRSVSEK